MKTIKFNTEFFGELEEKFPEYRYSEIFGETFQGEGLYCGTATCWIRWFGCNKTCYKFGNFDNIPEKDLYYNHIDAKSYTDVRDLPVQDVGCDSYYSWHKNFRHLAKVGTASEIADELISTMKNSYNKDGLFIHPESGQDMHLAFTGGESMLNQNASAEVIMELLDRGNFPRNITFETNGTIKLRDPIMIALDRFKECDGKVFWSVSPKLFSVSGECFESSIKPEVVAQYMSFSNHGQLKYVCNNTDACWAEVANATDDYYVENITWPIYIMPVGASAEMQHSHDAEVAEEAIRRGYYFAARVHCDTFNNAIGK